MTSQINPGEREMRQGVRRLHGLLPKARAEVRKGGHSFSEPSAIFEAVLPWIREDNLQALVVHPAPLGGFHTDLVLRQVPPGVSNAFGTPAQTPCRTREEAEQVAYMLLCMALAVEAKQREAPPVEEKDRGFELYDVSLKLPAEIYRIALDAFPQYVDGYGSPEAAVARIEAMLSELFPEGFTMERLKAMSRADQAEVQSVCLISTLSGVYRYPLLPHRPAAEGPFRKVPPHDDPS